MLCYAFVICLRLHYIRFTVVRAIISLFELHVNSSITFVSFEHNYVGDNFDRGANSKRPLHM